MGRLFNLGGWLAMMSFAAYGGDKSLRPHIPIAPVGTSLLASQIVSPKDQFYRDYLAQQDPEIWGMYFGAQPLYGSTVPGKEWGYDRMRAESSGRQVLAQQILRRRLDHALRAYIEARNSDGKELMRNMDKMKSFPIGNAGGIDHSIRMSMGFDLFADVTHFQVNRDRFTATLSRVGMLGDALTGGRIERGMGLSFRMTLNQKNTAAFANYAFDSRTVETGIQHPLPKNWFSQLTYRQGIAQANSSCEVVFVHRF